MQDVTDKKLLRARLDQAQRMEAIGTLAGGIAHDFNNILTPIIGYAELSRIAIPEDIKLARNMRQVLLSANRAKDLIKRILTISRETGNEPKPVQVSLIIEEVLDLLRSSLPSTIEIRQAIEEEAMDCTTLAEPTQIHQVLMNLCTNGAHAMRAKGGALTVGLAGTEVVQFSGIGTVDIDPGFYLRLTGADTGQGMDETVQERIFDPYFTTKGPEEGTGLGLAIVYRIVKNLRGAITVSSKLGQGAAFEVYLPGTKTPEVFPAPPAEPLPSGSGRVLLVDDEIPIVDMTREMLESLGYEVVARHNGADALEVFLSDPQGFDAVITDMTMPKMTGADLAGEILAIRADMPIILCTGFSDGFDEGKAKAAGIGAFLMKPVAMRDLALALGHMVAGGKWNPSISR
ncbi:MAG: response regulator [Syntrophobacteraceae bacterium]|nr:response regulator [Syntrophobacteraceae bacterium]